LFAGLPAQQALEFGEGNALLDSFCARFPDVMASITTADETSTAHSAARRVLFYSHDGTGLGHLRITLGVATAYAALRPQDSLLLLTGSLHTSAFALPENLDYVKLPAMPKRELYASLPPTEGFTGSHNSTIRVRSALALTTVQAFDPHLVVVDHAPGGLFRELAPSLEWLAARSPRPQFALLMRDITFSPEQTRDIWRSEGAYPYLDGLYDAILVYGEQEIFDPIAAYAMSDQAAARTRFCGFLAPQSPRRNETEVHEELGVGNRKLIAVSAGGGADGGPMLRAFLSGLKDRDDPAMLAYVVEGPLLPDEERRAVRELAAQQPNVTLVPFDADYAAVVRAADVVVSMGGYNSVVEAVSFGKRPVVVPRLPGALEQKLRAAGFAALGLAQMVPPETLSSETLWDAINSELLNSVSPPRSLNLDGVTTIASALAQLPVSV
jgi:predicted glycosyltransferase